MSIARQFNLVKPASKRPLVRLSASDTVLVELRAENRSLRVRVAQQDDEIVRLKRELAKRGQDSGLMGIGKARAGIGAAR